MFSVIQDRARGSGRDPSALRAPSRQAGFTLLEVIVATAIMATAVIALSSLIGGSIANASRVKQYDRAAMLARQQMGELLVSDPLPLDTLLSGNFDATSGWQARAETFELPTPPTPGQPMLVRIHLEVWWTSVGGRNTLDFESYRRIAIRP